MARKTFELIKNSVRRIWIKAKIRSERRWSAANMKFYVSSWRRKWHPLSPKGAKRKPTRPICHRFCYDKDFDASNNKAYFADEKSGDLNYHIRLTSSCGRVVKAIDSKSIGLCPRRFESYQLRNLFYQKNLILFFNENLNCVIVSINFLP